MQKEPCNQYSLLLSIAQHGDLMEPSSVLLIIALTISSLSIMQEYHSSLEFTVTVGGLVMQDNQGDLHRKDIRAWKFSPRVEFPPPLRMCF